MGNLLGAPVTEKETVRGSTLYATGGGGGGDEQGNNNSNNNTEKCVRFAVSSMQGWRVHMEDAHITQGRLYAAEPTTTTTKTMETSKTMEWNKIPLLGHSLYAVFDGHGGSFSALYSGRNLCRVLSRQTKFVQYAKLYTSTTTSTTTTTSSGDDLKALIQLLEGALTDSFVELDKEICLALKGNKVPDADKPFHEGEEDDHHHSTTSTATTNNQGPDSTTSMDSAQSSSSSSSMEGATGTNASNMAATTATNSSSLQLLDDEGDSGTTACVILLTPDCIICANAGDSRAIMRQKNGQTIPLSYDHKPDDEEEERRIRAAGGYVAGGRVEGDLAVSRGLGDFRFKDRSIVLQGIHAMQGNINNNNMETTFTTTTTTTGGGGTVTCVDDQKVSPIPGILVQPRNDTQDTFAMIACDGIWDVQTNEHASKLVHDVFQEGESDLGLICEEVCDICLRLGSKDNMTVLILQFPGHEQQQQMISSSQQQQASTSQQLQQQQQASTQTSGDSSSGGGGGVLFRRQAREAENNSTSTNVISLTQ